MTASITENRPVPSWKTASVSKKPSYNYDQKERFHAMPRTARIRSISGNYHIVLRGINKQRIFEEKQDYEKFLWILKDTKKECDFTVFAWCLMPNHIHLLIKERTVPISRILQKTGSKFVFWYNGKYNRTGHLFEDRFKSEPVDDESYFLRVIRYIHLNPVKAGLCQTPDEYPYSSYSRFFDGSRYSAADVLFGSITTKDFLLYHQGKNDDICMDIDNYPSKRLTDDQAELLIKQISGCERPALVQSLSDGKRNLVILDLLRQGASVRQINRLTGVTTRVIENIKQSK